MNIETDGTITPREAFLNSVDILIGQLQELKSFGAKGDSKEAVSVPVDETSPVSGATATTTDYQSISVEDIRLSSHTLNALVRAGFKTLGDLMKKTEDELRDIDGVGEKAIQEIHRELGNFGLTLPKE